MPTYDYRCEACKQEFEHFQKITEEPLKTCPKCGAPEVKRQITSGNFILRGGGWYADGYSGGGKDS